jgi:glycosyltransferase involved in cell wall biosynthesis
MKDALFVHNNFPGQFAFIAEALKARGVRCAAIASPTGRGIPGIPLVQWQPTRGSTEGIFPPATRAEADFIRGRAAAEGALALQKHGFNPDLIIGHPGWGETLFLKEIFPQARQIIHGEFYYRTQGADVGFDPEFGEISMDEKFRIHAKNATMALAYTEADRIVCPTPFQAGTLPEVFHPRIEVIHEGVDTDQVKPNPATTLTLPNSRVLDRSVPVITFINRRFEPLRGFHTFVRALPQVLAEIPEAQVVLIGSDEPGGYGGPAPDGTTWKQRFLSEVQDRLDLSRVHFTGRLPYDQMLAALSISAAHVYYTYPFVLSWSLLEAMASECLIVGSDTAPVRDAITHEANGLLLDFFDVDALARTLITACREPERYLPLRQAARQTVLERYDRTRQCQPAWLRLVDEVMAGQ